MVNKKFYKLIFLPLIELNLFLARYLASGQISGIQQNYWPDIWWPDIRPNQYPVQTKYLGFYGILIWLVIQPPDIWSNGFLDTGYPEQP